MLMRVQMTEVYRDWINSLKDHLGRARVQVRVDRLVNGNPGNIARSPTVCVNSRSTSALGTGSTTLSVAG